MPLAPLTSRLGNFDGSTVGSRPPLVVGGDEVHRVQLQVFQHQGGDGRHAGFGIPHGRRRQTGDRAEVPLLVDQHVPHVPFLGHADQRGIDDAFAVRMVVAAGVAGDLAHFDPRGAGRQVQVVHGHQDPPLRGLQAVADVGQRPADDHAHGVGEVALLELVFDRQLDDAARGAVSGGPLLDGEAVLFRRLRRKIGIGGQTRSFQQNQPTAAPAPLGPNGRQLSGGKLNPKRNLDYSRFSGEIQPRRGENRRRKSNACKWLRPGRFGRPPRGASPPGQPASPPKNDNDPSARLLLFWRSAFGQNGCLTAHFQEPRPMSDPKLAKQQPQQQPKRPANPAPQPSAKRATPAVRLASIDALRGFDMFWIVGGQGLIVSLLALLATRFAFAAGWKAFADEQLKHTTWEGFTAWDLIMPLFLFVVGVAMPFSLGQRIASGQSTGRIYRKVLLRVLILWVLGMIAQGNLLKFGTDEKQTLLLFSNTLQAIAVGYLVAAIALIHLPRWGQVLVTLGTLGLYWALMHWVPFAGHAAGTMEEKTNLALFLDSKLLGRFQSAGTTYAWILPSLGFAASVLLGVHSGQILRSGKSHAMKVFWLIVLGVACLAAGGLMAGWPVEFLRNKHYNPAGFVGQLMDWSFNGLPAHQAFVDQLHGSVGGRLELPAAGPVLSGDRRAGAAGVGLPLHPSSA